MDKRNPKGEQVASSAIFKNFLLKAEDYLRKPTRIKQLLNDAYQKASDKKDVGTIAHEVWETMQTLFRLIRSSVSGEYTGLPTTTVIAAVAVTIYFMSPIDLIPDFIPVLGLLDDVALVAWFSTTIKEELDKFAAWEKSRPSQPLIEDAYVIEEDKAAAAPKSPPVEAPAVHAPIPTASTPAAAPTPTATDEAKPHADVAANTTDSSREPNQPGGARNSGGDPGGNVR